MVHKLCSKSPPWHACMQAAAFCPINSMLFEITAYSVDVSVHRPCYRRN